MNRFLFYLERAWLTAAISAACVSLYQGIQLKTLWNPSVYFPAFCIAFCLLIFYNIRSQRLFRAKMQQESNQSSHTS